MDRYPISAETPRSGSGFETLDPEDWDGFRTLAHDALDEMIDLHRGIRSGHPWRPIPSAVEEEFTGGPPWSGAGPSVALEDFRRLVLPYPVGNLHPRFWGWALGAGSPMGTLAGALAAGMNTIPGVFNDSTARVEEQLVRWMTSVLGFPGGSEGVLTSGGSMANLVGLHAAREAKLGPRGLSGGRPPMAYASTEVHSSVEKAVRTLGLGREGLRRVEVDDHFRVRVPELLAAIHEDRRRGRAPFAIVGTVGTINTGGIDDIPALADIAATEGLWLHVDGAFGALAALSPELRGAVVGMDRADSLAFDFHKWLHAPYEAGCILVRDADALKRAFSTGAEYLNPLERGPARQPNSTNLRSPQLSRDFKALKVWLSIKEHGLDKMGRIILRNVRQAQHLGDRIDASPWFTRVAPVSLNVVAFRHHPPELSGEEADDVNAELLMRIQEEGVAVPSSTIIDERFTLRACICNHRTRQDDLDQFVGEAERILVDLRGGAPPKAVDTR